MDACWSIHFITSRIYLLSLSKRELSSIYHKLQKFCVFFFIMNNLWNLDALVWMSALCFWGSKKFKNVKTIFGSQGTFWHYSRHWHLATTVNHPGNRTFNLRSQIEWMIIWKTSYLLGGLFTIKCLCTCLTLSCILKYWSSGIPSKMFFRFGISVTGTWMVNESQLRTSLKGKI